MTTSVALIIEEWLDREQRPQAYLARRAAVAQETLVRILKDQHKASHPTLRKLERAMGLARGTLEAVQAQAKFPQETGKEA